MAASEHDLIVRAATIVDGTGGPSFDGDVAGDGGQIVSVGPVACRGRAEIDGSDQVLAPDEPVLVADAVGITATIVDGSVVVRDGSLATPGRRLLAIIRRDR